MMAEYIYDFKEPPDPEGYRGRLIRCKDCKHSRTIPLHAKVWDPDDDWMACRFHGRVIEEDDFCSWGERKEKVEYENADGITTEHFRIGYEKGRRDGYAEAITEIEEGEKNEIN